jgi:hypothetical protein
MAITFVGSATIQSNGSLSLPGGMQENDIVILLQASDSGTPAVPSGYTSLFADTGGAPSCSISYKFMGPTPDTSVAISDWSAVNQECAIAYVMRGVNVGDPIDRVAASAADGTGDPDPPSISTVTAGAAVFACGFLDDDNATVSALSGYSNLAQVFTNAAAGATCTIMVSWKEIASPASEDPGTYSTTGDDAWVGVSFALKPASGGGGGGATFKPGKGLTESVLLKSRSLVA